MLSEIDRFRRKGSYSNAIESLRDIDAILSGKNARRQLTSEERYKIAESAVDRGYRLVDTIKRDSKNRSGVSIEETKQEKEKILRIIKSIEEIVGEIRLRKHRLNRATTITAIIGLLVGLFFFSSNFTGYTISNLNQTSSNLIGVVCLAVGLIAGYFYFKRR